jgi:integrase
VRIYSRVLVPTLKACGLGGQRIGFPPSAGPAVAAFSRAGKDPRQGQRWLGHSQLTTTMNIYVHSWMKASAG